MGLCKCPKRKVTNLFCFEHDVNVCEHCIVSDHERCIVQSYVQWLQDSDYKPVCILCKGLLSTEPTVRLICYDVFHWSCLNQYASSLPSNTAPAGYQCPKCKECVFPPSNIVSPVADSLRAKLNETTWARIGLAQSIFDSSNVDSKTTDDENNGFVVVKKQNDGNNEEKKLVSNVPRVHSTVNTKQQIANDLHRAYNNTPNTSPLLDTPKSHSRGHLNVNQNEKELTLNLNNDRDSGENKYKKRPLFEWLQRLLRSRQVNSQRNNRSKQPSKQRRFCFLLLIIIICFLTFILTLRQLASISNGDGNEMPEFDPLNNPNIKVE